MISSDANQNINDPTGIGAISDIHGNANSPQAIGKRPVDKPSPYQLAVRNNDIGAVRCADHAGSETNVPNFSKNRSNLDGISHLQRVLKHKDKTRYEVVNNALETEPDAYAHGAHQERNLAQINSGCGQGDEKPEKQNPVTGKDIHSAGHTPRQTDTRQDLLRQYESDQSWKDKSAQDHCYKCRYILDWNLCRAHLPTQL